MISFDKFLDIVPRVEYFPEYETKGEGKGIKLDGIKALAYEGAVYKGKQTKVFAHIGFPENMERPVPAVVLVHGGGGHPEDVWIKKWNQRGYAAIAMDTTGYFPTKAIPYLYEGFAEGLQRELVHPFAEDGYVVGPDNSAMTDMDLEVQDQWMYQAVAAIILAHNILRNDPKVDNRRIGITGISWGGVLTSVAIGYDTRFSFAIPIYGSGYLSLGLSDLNNVFKVPKAERWHAESRFSEVKIPVMWLCWNDDCCFSINSNSQSYLDTKDNNPNTCLSTLDQMQHSHYHGYTPKESYWFADRITSGNAVPKVNAAYTKMEVCYTCSEKIVAARLFYIKEKMSYTQREKFGMVRSFMEQDWQIIDLDPAQTTAQLPADAIGKYMEFTLEDGVILTTSYTE